MTTVETIPFPRYAHPATNPSVGYPNFRDQVNPPPSSGKLTPTDAALNPVASATRPLTPMASSKPVPAFSVVGPSAAKRPVPMIIAAVSQVAVPRPSDRLSDVAAADGVGLIGANLGERLRDHIELRALPHGDLGNR